MNHRSLGALIVLNVVLLAGLLVVAVVPEPAQAQRRGRATYAMLAGRTRSRSSQDMVYVINTDSGQVVALLYKAADKQLEIVDRYNLAGDLEGRARAR